MYLISRKSAPYTVRAAYISNIRSISKFSRFQIFFPLIIPYHTHTTVVQTRNTHIHTHTHTILSMYQIIILVLFTFQLIYGCYIGHVDSGECVKARYVLEGKLEFCGQGYSWFELHPDYEVCVPMETVRYIYIYIKTQTYNIYTLPGGGSFGWTYRSKQRRMGQRNVGKNS